MNWRKHMVLIVGGGLAILLLLASLVLLFSFQGGYKKASDQLGESRLRLQRLIARNPFPSEANVAQAQGDLTRVRTNAMQLQVLLQRGHLQGVDMEPTGFARLLERASRRLMQKAQESNVVMPERFGFGFVRYAAGELPLPEDLPRLVSQLQAIEILLDILVQARVVRVVSMERTHFDEVQTSGSDPSPHAGRPSRRVQAEGMAPSMVSQVPPAQTNELYGVERLSVTFEAREAAYWEVLNAIAQHPTFMAVVDVRLENQLAAEGKLGVRQPVAPVGGERPAGFPVQYPLHDDRVVAGRENVVVSLTVDLYRFHDAFDQGDKP